MLIFESKKAEMVVCRLSFRVCLFFVLCGSNFEKQNSGDGIYYPVTAAVITQ